MCNGREAENKTAGPCYNKTISKCCPDSGQSYSFTPAVCALSQGCCLGALSQGCCLGAYGNATCCTRNGGIHLQELFRHGVVLQ